MKTRNTLITLVTLLLATQALAFAQTPKIAPPPGTSPNTTTSANTPAAAPGTAPPQEAASGTVIKNIYCPPIKKLMKKNMYWGAPGGWKSYSQSFVNEIDNFAGAQWVGINLGKMICVYKGKQTFEFPVVLQNDTLTPTPDGEKWSKQNGGYINCLSGDILDCPFRFEEEKADKDVYKELDFFKGKKDYLENDPSKPN